jgi:hypothetical protein
VKDSEWYHFITARERECLGYALQGAAAKNLNLTCVDLGPRIDRLAEGRDGKVPTLTTGSKLWMCRVAKDSQHQASTETFVGNRLLLGFEALMLQGFPAASELIAERDEGDSMTDVAELLLACAADPADQRIL